MNTLNNKGGAMYCGVVAVVLGTVWILLYLALNIEINSLILNKEKILGETTRPKVMILVGVGRRVWGRGWDEVVLVSAATS